MEISIVYKQFEAWISKNKTTVKIFLLIAYIVLNSYLITKHINWRDEAQAWLLARDLSIPGLFKQMAYEGHPCMWHLLLLPLAKFGLPYYSMNILSLAFMAIAAGVFLWKAPFSLKIKLCILFSSTFVFYYPVISRSYCFIPPILCLLAVYYPKRHEKPLVFGLLIALLIQTHVIMLGMAGAMSFFWLYEVIYIYRKEKKKPWLFKQAIGLSIPLLSLIILLLQLMNVSSSSAFNPRSLPFYAVIYEFVVNVLRIQIGIPRLYGAIVVCLFIAAFVYLLIHLISKKVIEGTKPLYIAVLSIVFQMAIYVFMYGATEQRYVSIHYIALWALWASWEHISVKRIRNVVLCAICVFFLSGWSFYFTEYHLLTNQVSYSDSYYCAEFIQNNIEEDNIIIVIDEEQATPLMPYCRFDNFYSLKTCNKFSFVTWIQQDDIIKTNNELCSWFKESFPNKNGMYVLYADAFPSKENYIGTVNAALIPNAELIYETTKPSLKERYQIYYIPLS